MLNRNAIFLLSITFSKNLNDIRYSIIFLQIARLRNFQCLNSKTKCICTFNLMMRKMKMEVDAYDCLCIMNFGIMQNFTTTEIQTMIK